MKNFAYLFLFLFYISCNSVSTNEEVKDSLPSQELEDSIRTIKVFYVAWGCACANWMTGEDFEIMDSITYKGGPYDCEKLGTCIDIEPANSSLEILERYWKDYNSIPAFELTGSFYKEYQEQPGNDGEKRYAKTFRYTSYKYMNDSIDDSDGNLIGKPLSEVISILNLDTSQFYAFDEPPMILRGIIVESPQINMEIRVERTSIINKPDLGIRKRYLYIKDKNVISINRRDE